jgi:SAM-dependent methyltransferase
VATPAAHPACRQCGSTALQDWGAISDATTFAGQTLPQPLAGGRLWFCARCALGQRQPVLAAEAYERLYAAAPPDVWQPGATLRGDQRRVVEQLLAAGAPTRVLDVGCYDGRLLATLPAGTERCGIEASAAAAAQAAGRGVRVLADRFSALRELAGQPGRFDAIAAVDVIEHVHEPHRLLADMAALLAPGGRLVLSTGSIEAEAWQRCGGTYWYGAFPEHLSYIGPAWARQQAERLGLRLAVAESFRYDAAFAAGDVPAAEQRFERRLHRARWARRLGRVAPGLERRLVRRLVCGVPGLFADHVLLVFQRPG